MCNDWFLCGPMVNVWDCWVTLNNISVHMVYPCVMIGSYVDQWLMFETAELP